MTTPPSTHGAEPYGSAAHGRRAVDTPRRRRHLPRVWCSPRKAEPWQGRQVVSVLTALWCLLGCGTGVTGQSPDDLRRSDPRGFEACVRFERAQPLDGQEYTDSIREALALARQAQTSALRSAAQPGRMPEQRTGQPGVGGGAARGGDGPDLLDVREACADAGYDFAGD